MQALESEPVLLCPACGFTGEQDEFDLVMLQGKAQLHCPSCDANLGSVEHALQHASSAADGAEVLEFPDLMSGSGERL